MFTGLEGPSAIYLSTRSTDMRKSIDGLSGEVQDYLGRNPVDGSLFVFLNRRRDKIKMLWWERDGFWVFYKRLEAGTFQLPQAPEGEERQWMLSAPQLQLILSGVDLQSVRMRKRYRKNLVRAHCRVIRLENIEKPAVRGKEVMERGIELIDDLGACALRF